MKTKNETAQDTYGIEPHIYHRRWIILAVCNISLIMIVMAVSSLNIGIPTIQSALNASGTDIQWIVDAYALVFAGLLLLGGALGDRFGRKSALIVGLLIFASFSFMASTSQNSPMLIAARGLMGIGSALIMPATLSIIIVSFPIHERAKAISIWAAFAGMGGAVGPIISGFLLENFWWGSIFLTNVIVCLVLATIAFLIIPKMPTDKSHPLDPVGSLISIIGLSSLIFGIIEGPDEGWLSTIVVSAFVISIVSIISFIIYENAIKNPMLDPKYFKIKGFSSGSIAITFIFVGMFGMFFLFVQYLQFIKGYTPLEAAVRLLPNAATFVIVAPFSPLLIKKIGVKKLVFIGFTIVAIGMYLMSTFTQTTHYTTLVFGIVTIAAGMSLLMPPCSQHIIGSLPKHKAGVGSAMNDLTREVGGAAGIAIAGSILAIIYRGKEKVGNSIGETYRATQAMIKKGSLSQPQAMEVISHAKNSYTSGMKTAFICFSIMVFVVGIISYMYLPNELPTE